MTAWDTKKLSGDTYQITNLHSGKTCAINLKNTEEKHYAFQRLKNTGFTKTQTEKIYDEILKKCQPSKTQEKKAQEKRIRFVLEQKNLGPLSKEVLTKIAARKRGEATEILVKEIMQENHIYTTRDDEKAEMWIYQNGVYVPQARTYIREFCRQVLGEAYTTPIASDVITKIEADTYIDQEEFFTNENKNEIAIENGILNLHTRKLQPFTPKKRFFNKHPVKYDKNADCPAIKKHLKAVLKYEQDIPVMQEIFGYLLYREYKIEKAFMFVGTGRNGKGKTIELMKRFIGIDNCVSVPLQQLEEDNFAMGELFQKMANLPGDLDKKALKNTGAFKTLTGRDMVSAARKYKPRVKFVNYAKLVFACNDLPITYDLSYAFFARWVILEFPYKFISKKEIDEIKNESDKKACKVEDPEIIEKISAPEELSGLLNMALDGLQRLLEKGEFSYSRNTAEVKRLWLRKSSSFQAFVMDCLEEDWESTIEKSELRKAYAMYCRKHRLVSAGDKAVKAVLSENFGVSDDRESVEGVQRHIWRGIRFNDLGVQFSQGSQGCHGFQSQLEDGKNALGPKPLANLATLTILQDVPAFVGEDMEEHGPFKKGEVVKLGARVAEILVKRVLAEKKA